MPVIKHDRKAKPIFERRSVFKSNKREFFYGVLEGVLWDTGFEIYMLGLTQLKGVLNEKVALLDKKEYKKRQRVQRLLFKL